MSVSMRSIKAQMYSALRGITELKLSTVLKVLGVLLLLAALWATSPSRLFPECSRGTDVPRYCVD